MDEPVLAVRVKLTQEAHHTIARPSLAQATVQLLGGPVRAHVAAATMREAIDLLQHRLRTRIEQARHHRHPDRRSSVPPENPWTGDGPEHRPDRLPRDPEERRVIRHKSYSLARRIPWALRPDHACPVTSVATRWSNSSAVLLLRAPAR
ncbi:ribosome-associated translation inhibitor RaiA [Streptacidiphilus sp. MAP12-33]|uniref:hypothetical protein n=1 Tax=Streptacidiphilus sp. MAP12-33 TaxID=3156266 RepID=UPI003518F369